MPHHIPGTELSSAPAYLLALTFTPLFLPQLSLNFVSVDTDLSFKAVCPMATHSHRCNHFQDSAVLQKEPSLTTAENSIYLWI